MQLSSRALFHSPGVRLQSPLLHCFSPPLSLLRHHPPLYSLSASRPSKSKLSRNPFAATCISLGNGVIDEEFETVGGSEGEKEKEIALVNEVREELDGQSLWNQMKEIVKFAAPATGLWICGPLMSLIDTAVIGQKSSIELAALGPGTVFCNYMSYLFMFLSIATSNLVATALARQSMCFTNRKLGCMIKMKCNIKYPSCCLLGWLAAS